MVVVLFVLFVLSLYALSISYRAGLDRRIATARLAEARVGCLARSAATLALHALRADGNAFDHPVEAWAAGIHLGSSSALSGLFGGATDNYSVVASVVDEERKPHVMRTSARAMEEAGLSAQQVASIYDWIDGDSVARAGGAEGEFYAASAIPHVAKNAAIECSAELRWIRDVQPDPLVPQLSKPPSIGDIVTSCGIGRINLNTALPQTLLAVGLSAEGVELIVRQRAFDAASVGRLEQRAFSSIEDERLGVLSDADRIIVDALMRCDSRHFSIDAVASDSRTGARRSVRMIARRSQGGIEVIEWR